MITNGSILKLSKNQSYTIKSIGFEINEISGNYWAFVEMSDNDGLYKKYPIEMILSSLKESILYVPENEYIVYKLRVINKEFMVWTHTGTILINAKSLEEAEEIARKDGHRVR